MFERRTQEAQSVGGFVWKKGLQAMAYEGCRCFQKSCDQPTDDVNQGMYMRLSRSPACCLLAAGLAVHHNLMCSPSLLMHRVLLLLEPWGRMF